MRPKAKMLIDLPDWLASGRVLLVAKRSLNAQNSKEDPLAPFLFFCLLKVVNCSTEMTRRSIMLRTFTSQRGARTLFFLYSVEMMMIHQSGGFFVKLDFAGIASHARDRFACSWWLANVT